MPRGGKKGGKKDPEVVEIPVKPEDVAANIKDLTKGLGALVFPGGGAEFDLSKLPDVIVKRLSAIEALQKTFDGVHARHMEELAALERRFVAEYAPLYQQRKDIILGTVDPAAAAPASAAAPEPTAAAAPLPPNSAAAEVAQTDAAATASAAVVPSAGPAIVGVPGFWLQAIKNHPDLGDLVTPADEELLGLLQDVTLEYLPEMAGFKLLFTFAPNAYFDNAVLTKEYTLESMLRGEPSLLNIEAGEINWKAGKNLTVKRVKKKSKKGKATFKEVKTDSFFNFFSDPSSQDGPQEAAEDEDDDDEDVYGKIHADFSQGLVFKDQLIPNAYKWFTGEGEDGDFDDDDEDGEDEDDDDDDDDDDEEEEEEEDDKKKKKGSKKKPAEDDDDEDDDEDDEDGTSADVKSALSAAFSNANTGSATGAEKPADCKTQ